MEGRELMPDALDRVGRIKYMTAKLTPADGIGGPARTEPLRVADPNATASPPVGGVSQRPGDVAPAAAQQRKTSGWMQRRR
jgi:hypothetical protein